MGNILYGDISSEHMLFNDSYISDSVISSLYRPVRRFSYGYRYVGNESLWFYVCKYSTRGSGYISAVSEENCSENGAAALFEKNFHTQSEFEQVLPVGSGSIDEYDTVYPDDEYIIGIYQKLTENFTRNKRVVIIMDAEYGDDVFLSDAIVLLRRLLSIIPEPMRKYLSFTISDTCCNDNSDICISSSKYELGASDSVIDCTKTLNSSPALYENSLCGYWTSYFNSNNNSDDELEEIFTKCVKADKVVQITSVKEKRYNPYLYLYNYYHNRTYSNYKSILDYTKACVDVKILSQYIDPPQPTKEDLKKPEYEDQKQVDIVSSILNMNRRNHDEYISFIEKYLWYLLSKKNDKFRRIAPKEKNEINTLKLCELEMYLRFFEVMMKLCNEMNAGSDLYLSSEDFKWEYEVEDASDGSTKAEKPLEFSLNYKDITSHKRCPAAGLAFLLKAIYNVKNCTSGNNMDNNCFRKISGNIYFNDSYTQKGATIDHETFFVLCSLVILYVYVDRLGYNNDDSEIEYLKIKTIEELFDTTIPANLNFFNIALYQFMFLYGAMLGFFYENTLRGTEKNTLISEQNTIIKNTNFNDKLKFLQNRVNASNSKKKSSVTYITAKSIFINDKTCRRFK